LLGDTIQKEDSLMEPWRYAESKLIEMVEAGVND
jgi:hypothetical protein